MKFYTEDAVSRRSTRCFVAARADALDREGRSALQHAEAMGAARAASRLRGGSPGA